MLGITMREDPLVAHDYADRVGGTFPVLADSAYLAALLREDEYSDARKMVASYTINNYPTHVFIDRDGTVRPVMISSLTYDDAITLVTAILTSSLPAGLLPVSTPVSSPAS